MSIMSLDRILLSFPTLLPAISLKDGKASRSWIQLARTGTFVSTRYGKFSISKDDLSTMLHNFNTITPKDPTELPIDYDHLSMDPKKPGDGIAAGWMKKLELREDGDELWCEAEWTPDGAERIENKEYRFVSPSFVKNHTHKDGKKIGTTLLAAAITNHPFLEGMSALTLYNFSTIGDLALADAISLSPPDKSGHYDSWDACVDDNQDKDDPKAFCAFLKARRDAKWDIPAGVVALSNEVGDPLLAALDAKHAKPIHLSEIGQRVMIAPGNARTQDEIGGTFEITEVVGDGENAFVTIKDANGVPHKWFRATELLPASATPANPIQPNLEPAPGTPAPGAPKANTPQQEDTMQDTTKTEQQAAAFLRRLPKNYTADDVRRLSRQYPEESEAYQLAGVGAEPVNDAPYRLTGVGTAPEARPGVLSLHRQAGETFLQLVTRVRHERALPDWKAAYRLCADAFPALAEEYGQGTAL